MKPRRQYSERKLIKALKGSMHKAKAYLDDDKKMEALFRDFEEKLALIPGVGDTASDIAVMCSLIRAYSKKQYTDIQIGTVLLEIALIIYVVNPMDLVPDYIPVAGLMDDAAAIGLVLNMVQIDLNKYKKWQRENGKR